MAFGRKHKLDGPAGGIDGSIENASVLAHLALTNIAWARLNSGVRKNNAVTAFFARSICNTSLSTDDLAHPFETTPRGRVNVPPLWAAVLSLTSGYTTRIFSLPGLIY